MPTTTNFGWTTPADTDLVKDGALAIRTLAGGIDTSMVGLKGGTTGQILSKTSNTDMAFTWITNDVGDITAVTAGTGISGGGTSGAVTITNSMATEITAAGDLILGTGSGTFDNLPIGTTGQILTADTTVSPYKVKWATAASPTYSGVSVYSSVDQSINNATATALAWDSEDFDTDGYHSTSSNTSRLTIPSGKGGKYLLTGNVLYTHNATGLRAVYIYKNGAIFNYNAQLMTTTTSPYAVSLPFNFVMSLAAGDYVQVYAWQTSGGALNVLQYQSSCGVQLSYLGA